MRIALATCAKLPEWDVDDQPLFAVFAARGVEAVAAIWDDPSGDWGSFDACLIRTTWDYMEKRDAFVAWAYRVESQTRLFNSARIVEWNTHKTYLRDLEARGVPIAPTIWLRSGESVEVAALMRQHAWKRGFLKPVVGATARETLRFAADEKGLCAAQQHLDRTLAREDMLLQPYLSRVETEGERSVIFINGRFSHAVQKTPVPGDYRVQDDFGGTDRVITLSADELALAERVCACVDADLLYGRVDFLTDDHGALVLSELEIVEPSLFFRHCPQAAERLADALIARVRH